MLDFLNSVKRIQNAFVSKALQLPSGHAHLGAVKTWKRHMDDATPKGDAAQIQSSPRAQCLRKNAGESHLSAF